MQVHADHACGACCASRGCRHPCRTEPRRDRDDHRPAVMRSGRLRTQDSRAAAVIRVDAVRLAREPLDMRADTESALTRVVNVCGQAQPHHARQFANRPGNRKKALVHAGIGVWLAARRLHSGKFVRPTDGNTQALTRAPMDVPVLGLPWQRVGESGVIRVLWRRAIDITANWSVRRTAARSIRRDRPAATRHPRPAADAPRRAARRRDGGGHAQAAQQEDAQGLRPGLRHDQLPTRPRRWHSTSPRRAAARTYAASCAKTASRPARASS
ncbi:MAG: hypothetical protein C0505_20490 [Leptothrix sp. (in: Bacteria)]|nr:hypothetical protein [Leptothrix sp. (in: b-proteobacteria)]